MKIIQIDTTSICISENCYLYDTGVVDVVEITIGEGIQVEYCFVSIVNRENQKYSRHITIGPDSTFIGTGVLMGEIDIEIITEIAGDHATSSLDILALATDNSHISARGVARVASPYRQVSTRVDQTNILIGTGAGVRGVPKLEIATDDIEGGHSCRIHRLGGESLFYLTSRGLSEQHAETLLLNSEILKHLRTIETSEREQACYEIHQRLIKKSA